MADAITDEMADAVALVGPVSRGRERIEQYRSEGCDVTIFAPNPVGEDYSSAVRRVVKAFAKLN